MEVQVSRGSLICICNYVVQDLGEQDSGYLFLLLRMKHCGFSIIIEAVYIKGSFTAIISHLVCGAGWHLSVDKATLCK